MKIGEKSFCIWTCFLKVENPKAICHAYFVKKSQNFVLRFRSCYVFREGYNWNPLGLLLHQIRDETIFSTCICEKQQIVKIIINIKVTLLLKHVFKGYKPTISQFDVCKSLHFPCGTQLLKKRRTLKATQTTRCTDMIWTLCCFSQIQVQTHLSTQIWYSRKDKGFQTYPSKLANSVLHNSQQSSKCIFSPIPENFRG